MFSEDDLVPISALQHLAFCERQWGLIYIEGIWDENRLTAEGKLLHEKADNDDTETRFDLKIAHGLRLRSLNLGLTGRADIVEFHQMVDISAEGKLSSDLSQKGISLKNAQGIWRPFPVEYKHGQSKINNCDRIQLCAQALCLEEMLNVTIEDGAIFYGRPRRREAVTFSDDLRMETKHLTKRLHIFNKKAETPLGKYEQKCRSCSLLSYCLPKVTGHKKSAKIYLAQTTKGVEL